MKAVKTNRVAYRRGVVGFLLLASLFSTDALAKSGQGTPHWGYEGSSGPEHWGNMAPEFATCSEGLVQSPIDLHGVREGDLPPISFHYASVPLGIVNNGHTIQVNYAEGSYAVIGGSRYALLQFHFHTLSEHLVDGRPFAMEAHFVHRSADGELAVVGVLLEEGASNPFIETLWDHLPKSQGHEERPAGVVVNGADLLPNDGSYYHYDGSLTTPPCSEGVNWNVLSTPRTVSSAQVKRFAALFHANARPVQEVQGRKVVVVNAPMQITRLAGPVTVSDGDSSTHSRGQSTGHGSAVTLLSHSRLSELEAARNHHFEVESLVAFDAAERGSNGFSWFVIGGIFLIIGLSIAAIQTRFAGDLRIQTKLQLGFGSIALVTVVASATSLSLLGAITHESHNAEELLKMETTAAHMATLQNEFLNVGIVDAERGEEILGLHEVSSGILHDRIDEIESQLDEDSAAAISAVKSELTKYDETFAQIVERYHEIEVLKVELDEENEVLDQHLSSILHEAAGNLEALEGSGASISQIQHETHVVEALSNLEMTALRLAYEQAEFMLDKKVERVAEMEAHLATFDAHLSQGSALLGAAGTRQAKVYLEQLRESARVMGEVRDNISTVIVDELTIEAANWESLSEVEAIEVALDEMAKRAEQHANEARLTATRVTFIVLGVVLASALLLAVIISRAVAVPVKAIQARVRDIAEGDLTQRLDVDCADEIGDLAQSLNLFIDKVYEMVEAAAKAGGQMTSSAQSLAASSKQLLSGSEAVATLSNQTSGNVEVIQQSISTVASAIEQVSTSIAQSSAATEQASSSAATVASNAGEMSTNVQSAATAVEELSASMADVASNSGESAAAGRQSAEQAEQAAHDIETLSDAAHRIGTVVGLIDDVAAQTKLLALNATIEAASAGEAGRGFAVVASEIKDLAAQTERATEEIRQEVTEIQGATQKAVDGIKEVAGNAGRVDELATVIAGVVKEQSLMTGEIASNVTQNATAANDVSVGVAEISGGLEKVARQAVELSTGADEIAKTSANAVKETNEITAAIAQLRDSAAEASEAANAVSQAATEGQDLAQGLEEVVGRFKI